MYKYYTAFESEEHYLYPKEVAELWQMYAISDSRKRGKFNDILANEILKESSDELKKSAIYYETRYGLKRVFDHETILHTAESLRQFYEEDGAVLYYPVNGKRYKFVIGEDNITPALLQLEPERFEEDGTYIKSYDRMIERREELKNRKKVKQR